MALRADARRNREKIMASALTLFASRGHEAQMEEIAAHCGLGIGTLYRHFPSKQALLTAMVSERFAGMAGLARAAGELSDPGDAFATLLRRYLEATEGDASFQLALMGAGAVDWPGVGAQKAEFAGAVTRVIERAVHAGAVRGDFTFADFRLVTRGVIATMYFKDEGGDWRRHLQLALDGITGGSAGVHAAVE